MKKVLLTATAILALGAINACSFEPTPCEKKIAEALELSKESKALRAEGQKIMQEAEILKPENVEELDNLVRTGQLKDVTETIRQGNARLHVITAKMNENTDKLVSEHPAESFAEVGCTKEQMANFVKTINES